MKNWFNFKNLCSKKERTLGFAVRFVGLDLSFVLAGFIDDMALVNLQAFKKGVLGVYFQLIFICVFVGCNSEIYNDNIS